MGSILGKYFKQQFHFFTTKSKKTNENIKSYSQNEFTVIHYVDYPCFQVDLQKKSLEFCSENPQILYLPFGLASHATISLISLQLSKIFEINFNFILVAKGFGTLGAGIIKVLLFNQN
jgi:hypothetical protein